MRSSGAVPRALRTRGGRLAWLALRAPPRPVAGPPPCSFYSRRRRRVPGGPRAPPGVPELPSTCPSKTQGPLLWRPRHGGLPGVARLAHRMPILADHVADYLRALRPDRSEVMLKMEAVAERDGVPIVHWEAGRLLATLCRALDPVVLEVGTAIGYSTLHMAEWLER